MNYKLFKLKKNILRNNFEIEENPKSKIIICTYFEFRKNIILAEVIVNQL